jgi:hypothetical protein
LRRERRVGFGANFGFRTLAGRFTNADDPDPAEEQQVGRAPSVVSQFEIEAG